MFLEFRIRGQITLWESNTAEIYPEKFSKWRRWWEIPPSIFTIAIDSPRVPVISGISANTKKPGRNKEAQDHQYQVLYNIADCMKITHVTHVKPYEPLMIYHSIPSALANEHVLHALSSRFLYCASLTSHCLLESYVTLGIPSSWTCDQWTVGDPCTEKARASTDKRYVGFRK